MDDNSSDPHVESDDARVVEGLPQHTTPTWEVELLISGIAVFAMLQLPGWLDDRFFDLRPRFDTDWLQALLMGYECAKMGALILAGTFVLHQLLRAHWIALVGMDSVYPTGVRWDRIRMGRQQREVERTRLVSIADAIERADNRATVVFAVGVYMTMQMARSFLVVLAVGLLSYIFGFFVPIEGGQLFGILLAAVMLPIFIAWQIDRRIGARLAPDGRVARALRMVFRFYAGIGFSRSSTPGILLVSSNEGFLRFTAMTFVIVFAAVLVTIFEVDAARDPARIGSYAFLPKAGRDTDDTLIPEHYDDQRDSVRLGTIPFVQSQWVTDAYLRLAIPFQPSLHNAAMQRSCPAALGASSATGMQRHRAVLDCLAALHPLTLDGHPLKDVHHDLGSDPKARRPALIVMIDVRALANGRHELLVSEPNQPDGSATPSDKIPFWR